MKAKLYDVEPISSQNNNNTETLKIFMVKTLKRCLQKNMEGFQSFVCFNFYERIALQINCR